MRGNQVWMVRQRRGVIARVVRSHDDITAGGEEQGHQYALGVRLIGQISNVETEFGGGPVRIQHDRARSLARGGRTGGHHERAGSSRRLVGPPNGVVLDVIDVHSAGGRTAELQHLVQDLRSIALRTGVDGDLRKQRGGGIRGEQDRRILQQHTRRRRGARTGAPIAGTGTTAAASAATSHQQSRRENAEQLESQMHADRLRGRSRGRQVR